MKAKDTAAVAIDWRPINEIEHYFNLPMSEFYCLIFIDKKGNYYLGKDWEIANIFVSGFFDYGAKFDLNEYSKIVLTIAHLDDDPTNNNYENLRALCQKCHLNYDKDLHRINSAITRRKNLPIKDMFL